MNRALVGLGILLVIAGVAWPWLRRIPFLHLPGDIVIDRPGFRFFLPITSMILVGLIISLMAWLFRR